jgi:nitrogen regulatory protein P-II 2
MKFIVAIIQPHRLDVVREALLTLGIEGMTVSEVRGYGRQKGHKEIYRGAEYRISFVPKLKIEVAIASERAEAVVAAIGDGKIFVFDMESAMRIRTGETGADAL